MSPRKNRFYQTLNQPPRSPNGKHRRANQAAHGRAAGESSDGAGAYDSADALAYTLGALDPARVPGTATYQRARSGGMSYARTGLPPATWRMLNSGHIEEIIKPSVIPYAGIRAGEIIGHRAWYVREDNSLGSLAHDFIWPAAQIEGNVDEIVAPAQLIWPAIYGGVYAYQTYEQLCHDCLKSTISTWFPTTVSFGKYADTWRCKFHAVFGLAWGTISMWGEVIEHETGYRAQFARVKSIDGAFGEVDLDAIRNKYGV